MIYLDNAASTPLSPEVKDFYFDAINQYYANPHAGHSFSRECSQVISRARLQILKAAKAQEAKTEVIWTSCGTESNNLILLGKELQEDDQVITCSAEHPSNSEAIKHLEKCGTKVLRIKLTPQGTPDLEQLQQLISDKTRLISITALNNETGALTDMEKLSEICRPYPKCHLHIDAVQAFGKRLIEFNNWGIHSLALAGHKFHGPNSSAALICRKSHLPKPLMFGGGQQEGIRPGTVDAAAVASLGFAAQHNAEFKASKLLDIQKLNQACREGISQLTDRKGKTIKSLIVSSECSSPYILLVSFPEYQGAVIMRALSAYKIIIGTGSACAAEKQQASPTLSAMGLSDKESFGVIRISFGWQNTLSEIEEFVQALQDFIISY